MARQVNLKDIRIVVDDQAGKAKLLGWAAKLNQNLAGVMRRLLDTTELVEHDGAWHFINIEDPIRHQEQKGQQEKV